MARDLEERASESPPPDAPTLVVLHVSPWTERVRWALDHHAVRYRVQQHAPFIGERRLRRLVGAKERATVPVLVQGERVITESWDIAKHADEVGGGATLFPAGKDDDIRRWVDRADESAQGGRALVLSSMLDSGEALDEGLPREVPRWLRPLMRPVTRYGTKWFARKYGLPLHDIAGPTRALCDGLDALRGALAGDSQYLLGTFSYADIVMATLLQGITPVDDRYIRLGPATRAAWTQPRLASEYDDLLRWRDGIYARHRPTR